MESSTPFNSGNDVYQWIEGFVSLERDLGSRPMKIEIMKKLCSLAGMSLFAKVVKSGLIRVGDKIIPLS